MKKLLLKDITIDAGTQTRVSINEDVVAEYAERMTEGDKFPAVVVFHDGTTFFLADGFHRVLAATRNAWRDIEADVRKGTKEDAIKFGLGANRANGLRRTNADKRRCVEIALATWPKQSARTLAEWCGVSADFTARVRSEQVSFNDTSVTGLDGKEYPAHRPCNPHPTIPRGKPRSGADVEYGTDNKKERRMVGPPCNGMQFARMAIMQLEQIRNDDAEKYQAFKTVKGWIEDHETET